MDLSKYRSLFVSETHENLDELARLLVEVEKSPADQDSVNTIFRLFHSIKGMSGTMGYQPLFDLAHQLEELMDQVRLGRHALDATTVDVLLAGVDYMVQWIRDVDAERPLVVDYGVTQLGERIDHLVGGSTKPRDLESDRPVTISNVPPPETPPVANRPAKLLNIEVTAAHTVTDPGVRGFLLLRKLEALGSVRSSRPPVELLRANQLEGPLRLALQTVYDADKLEAFVRLMPDWTEVRVGYNELSETAGDTHLLQALESIDLDFIENPSPPLLTILDDSSFAPPEPSTPPGIVRSTPSGVLPIIRPHTLPPLTLASRPSSRPLSGRRHKAVPRTVRVKTRWLDDLLDRVGDLLIVSQRLWSLNQQAPTPTISSTLSELSRLLNRLHTESLSARVTSFSVLTDRLPRVVRDLARLAGKRASLVVEGDDEQLDRAIIEGLDAPLTHLLRNAVEHGIERPSERTAANKPATGILTLSCVRVRDEIIVELRDDGRGIDPKQVVDRVVEQGLLDEETALRYAQHDLRRLLCLPGFTTRKKAGVLAGRGVGLDAVNVHLTALGGTLEVRTELGVGTRMRLRVPRTPGISKLLLVRAGDQIYGLPLNRVIRSGSFDRATMVTEAGVSTVLYQGEPHRLLLLNVLLGVAQAPLSERFSGVIFRGPSGPLILAVDQLVGQRDAVIKPLGSLLERIDGLHGVTLNALGQPVFVLDLDRAWTNWLPTEYGA